MALIYCSYCGGRFSDKAAACPHCGAAHERTQRPNVQGPQAPFRQPNPTQPQEPTLGLYSDEDDGSNAKWWILGIALLIAGVFLASSLIHGNTDTNPTAPVEVDSVMPTDSVECDSVGPYDDYYSDYDDYADTACVDSTMNY